MKENIKFAVVVGGILLILLALFLNTGHIRHAQEQTAEQYANEENEEYRLAANEAAAYSYSNKYQQIGIAITAAVVILISAVWWVRQRRLTPPTDLNQEIH